MLKCIMDKQKTLKKDGEAIDPKELINLQIQIIEDAIEALEFDEEYNYSAMLTKKITYEDFKRFGTVIVGIILYVVYNVATGTAPD